MVKAQLEEGNLVLCTVTKIMGTSVFVNLDDYHIEGAITFPEIAPGRIRNIRDYAFPGKKIICKILSVRSNHVELSLRRVKVNERNEFNEHYKKEKSYSAMIRTMLGEKGPEIIDKIKETEDLVNFIESSKETPGKLEKYLNKEQAQKILSILGEKKIKEKVISKKFSLSSKASNGINLVKATIKEASKDIAKEVLEVSYTAAGKYLIKIKTKDPRISDQQLRKMIESLESISKKNGCVFNEEKD